MAKAPATTRGKAVLLGCTMLLTSISGSSIADDTDVFFGGDNPPNLLLILDASGSMTRKDGGTVSRLDRMKSAIDLVLDNLDNVNVGLMQFTSRASNGGIQLLQPVGDVSTTKDALRASVQAINASGGTPTAAALYESYRYYTGGAPVRGTTLDGAANYTSPISHECQSNHVVLLTDGIPSADGNAVTTISGDLGSCLGTEYGEGGKCAIEVARHMATNDLSNAVPDTNNVKTHAIGFNFTTQWLKDIASNTNGDGTFHEAASADDLVAAFASILNDIRSQDNSFAAPAITVDQFSPLTNREDVYLTLFQPSSNPRWRGNLKRYKFSGNPPLLRDVTPLAEPAIDPTTGSIKPTARSGWSSVVDGDQIALGGAAEQLNHIGRKVVTYNGVSTALMAASNLIHEDNNLISAADLDATNGAEREKILKWARGIDVQDDDGDGVDTDTRNEIADPLHSQPTIVNYGGTATNPDSVVFFGTNQGYLHAIDAETGGELFSFVPSHLLKKLKISMDNQPSSPKPYGMDGDITVWRNDANRNREIESNLGEHVYLYAGMRRGGENYYALDVTDKNNPKHLWTIEGGTGEFARLGQSWSKPVLGKIRLNGSVIDVLVFAGGYDVAQDSKTVRSADTTGNAVFIVNANTGELIWEASASPASELTMANMIYSMPSDPTVIDLNGDQMIDQIYIADLGGQIHRFDMNLNAATKQDLVSGGTIANLAGDTVQTNRRFFYQPDVSLINDRGSRFLSVSIGSGNRADPLETTVNNRFYMIRQPVESQAGIGYGRFDGLSYKAIKDTPDLFDATSNVIMQGNATQRAMAQQALNDASGWFLELEAAGEKNLSSSITINSQIVFSTYLPLAPATACGAAIGSGRAYAVNVLDGTPVYADSDGNYTKDTRYIDLDRPGIPPRPVPFFGDENSMLAGNQTLPELDFGKMVQRVYWTEQF
jgi:type IV pilus assembly protein PilY1